MGIDSRGGFRGFVAGILLLWRGIGSYFHWLQIKLLDLWIPACRLPHPHDPPYSRCLPFLVSAVSQSQASLGTPPTPVPVPVPSDPRAAFFWQPPFNRILFPDSFPLETPPSKEEEDATARQTDGAVASAVPLREEMETERVAWRLLRRAVVSYLAIVSMACTARFCFREVVKVSATLQVRNPSILFSSPNRASNYS
jgi:hypothetical protein